MDEEEGGDAVMDGDEGVVHELWGVHEFNRGERAAGVG